MAKHDWTVEDFDEYKRRLTRESQKRRRAKAKARGLCSTCCRHRPKPGHVTCQSCIDRINARQKKRREGINE